MRRAFAVLLAALLLVNPCLPGVAVAVEEATIEHVSVTPVLTGEQAEDGTYTSPVQVTFTVTPGDPELILYPLKVSLDGETWEEYTGEWPIHCSEGDHTVYWHITEFDLATGRETLYEGSVSFTVALEHATVTPFIFGEQISDGVYSAPVWVVLQLEEGEVGPAFFDAYVDGVRLEWPIDTLRFTEGTHTVAWHLTEYPYYGDPFESWGEITFTVVPDPMILTPTVSGVQGDAGWYRSAVTITLAEAPESAPAAWFEWSFDGSSWEPYSDPIPVSAEGTTTLYYRGVSWEGHPGAVQSLDIAIDTQAPGLDVMNPWRGEKLLLNASTGLVWSAVDVTSGMAEGYPQPPLGEPLDTTQVGDHSITVTARDVAGNERVLAVPYRVIYRFGGFEKPLAVDGSTFKSGETIGIKFSLADAQGSPVSSAQAQLQVARADDLTAVVATGTFREAKAGKYTYDLRTKGLAPGGYVITATLDDGESYSVAITLK